MNNNCNHQNEHGNFCSQCGIALKEKCPECGEMEKIERRTCETRLQKIKDEKGSFIFNEAEKIKTLSPIAQLWLGFLVAMLGFPGLMMILSGIFGVIYRPNLVICGIVASLVASILFWSVEQKIKKNRQKINFAKISAEQEFLRLHPEYTEILKQAEEEK